MTNSHPTVVGLRRPESARTTTGLALLACLSFASIPGPASASSLFAEHMEFAFASDVDYPSGQLFTHSATGDFNGDGFPDVAVPVYGPSYDGTSVSILLGRGDGTFSPKIDVPTATGPWNVAVGDLDRDGHADLAVVSHLSGILSVHLGNGDGTFGPRTEYLFPAPLEACALGDLNGDLFPDLVTTSYSGCPAPISVRLNNGDGTLGPATTIAGLAPHGVVLADLNRDGRLDMAVANEYAFDASCSHQRTVSVAFGNGNGSFQAWTLYQIADYAHRLAVVDLDGVDGPDIVTANSYWNGFSGTTVSVLLNRGDGTFDPHVDYPVLNAIDVDAADFNGDGALDIAAASWSVDGAVVVLFGLGDGTFHPGITYGVRSYPNVVNARDLNGDGRIDLVTANPYSNTISVLLNVGCDPLRETITGVFPSRGGDIGGVDASIYGCGFVPGASVRLARAGEPDIVANLASVGTDGVVEASFDLTGRAHGPWNVVVTNPDLSVAVRPAGFTIETGRPAEVWAKSYGRYRNRVGRTARASQDGGNKGNVTYHAWAIACRSLSKPPTDLVTIALGSAFGDGNPVVATRTPPELGAFTLPWGIKNGPTVEQFYTSSWIPQTCPQVANDCVALFQAQSQGNVSGGAVITNFRPDVGQGQDGLLLRFWKQLAPVPVPPDWPTPSMQFQINLRQKVNVKLEALVKQFTANPGANLALASADEVILQAVDQALTDLDASYHGEVTAYRLRFDQVRGTYRNLFRDQLCDLSHELANEPQNPPATQNWRSQTCRPLENSCSADPNEKTGPSGVGAMAYVSDALPLSYTVNFENLATASLPAVEVVVTDQLDPTKVDLSTFTFGPVAFGDRTVLPPPSANPARIEVDLRPQQDLIVRILEYVNATTGMLTCRFESIDPATGLAPDDPSAGFLPPNVTSPEGEGSIRFNVMPRAGIASGTAIPNHASIVFDVNPPIATGEWLNTIDTGRPSSQVQSLEYLNPDTAVVVRWSGSDDGSGVEDYLVYLSVDDGPFALWRAIPALEDTLSVQDGHRYAFYSIARDLVGNIEDPPPVPDKTISVLLAVDAAPPPRLALERIAPNPLVGSDLVVSFTLPSAAPALLELVDIAGRRIAQRSAGGTAPGRYLLKLSDPVLLSPGIYIVRLSQAGRSLHSRVAILR